MTDKLDIAVEVYRHMEVIGVENGRVSGRLPVEAFECYRDRLASCELLLEDVGDTGEIVFQLPFEVNDFFALSIEDLLQGSTRKQNAPMRFFVADLDYIYTAGADNVPGIIQAYMDVVGLIAALMPHADYHVKKGVPKFVFLHGGKLELILDYADHNLSSLTGVREFVAEFLSSGSHAEQKLTIVKSVLEEFHEECPGQPFTLGLVLDRFEEFARRVSSSYQLYVSEFSFQKIKSEVEKSKFEAVAKINKVFSDIQNQLLAVPVALVLVCNQLEVAPGLSLKNVFILLGSLIFSVFMFMLILNQRNTLATIFMEISSEWEIIKGKHNAVKMKFDAPYNLLRRRFNYQVVLLELVGLVVFLSMLFSVLMFGYYYYGSEWSLGLLFFVYVLFVFYYSLRISFLLCEAIIW